MVSCPVCLQVNHRWVTALKEDGDQRIHWKSLQVGPWTLTASNAEALRFFALSGVQLGASSLQLLWQLCCCDVHKVLAE
jgi:hypothetical protein